MCRSQGEGQVWGEEAVRGRRLSVSRGSYGKRAPKQLLECNFIRPMERGPGRIALSLVKLGEHSLRLLQKYSVLVGIYGVLHACQA